MSAPDRRAMLDRADDVAVGSAAMRASERGALGRLRAPKPANDNDGALTAGSMGCSPPGRFSARAG